MKSIIISGTDTGVGKTMLSALLMASLPEYFYWKPVQSGMSDGTDSQTVLSFSGCSQERIIPEVYIFSQPLSPHLASRLDGTTVDSSKLSLPRLSNLIIEGAGGLLVPLTDDLFFIDHFKTWNVPVLLACRSTLGTINHTLLSLEALRKREIPIVGCVLIGEVNSENEKAIEQFGNVKIVGRIPQISSFSSSIFRSIFNEQFTLLRSILE
jgi:dethiobiotin synthetase